ncbi:HAD family hydrolase [Gimesia fumaroli]|uniref:Haloacid dehalogenase-like hydrolase n=1 Tax=Gimesia fumaroli TaxID=2527976 RepID=A0A518IER1_9PLAN|nr:HAD family hydrolase [Gimesia fumaroli]QDV51583.1 haloacid dehalogenase-like hydrolase [Gimesia fumaroli]
MRHALVFFCLFSINVVFAADPLPSWNAGPAKDAIINYVKCATNDGCPLYVTPQERIAVFDNDGTLWSEQPAYFQLLFALDRVRALADQHPEWKTEQPFKAVLENDFKTIAASGKAGLLKIMAVTHTGMTTDEFEKTVRNWIKTARHPEKQVPYTKLVFQPMLELLNFLRANGFKTYIVSGGGIDFLRVWTEDVYGIPPEQVIGSSIKVKLEQRDGKPVLVRQAEIDLIDDKEGKPVGIHRYIGRAPVMAFGNSDGDLQMLQWTDRRENTLKALVHHTDAKREYAYDRESHIGQLDQALKEAQAKGWTVIDMQRDWKRIYPAPTPDN